MWCSAYIDDQGEDEEAENCDDLDGCEDELSLSVNGDGEDVQTEHHHDDDGDPRGDVDVYCAVPILDDGRGSRDFGAQGESGGVPVVPANSKAHCIVDVAGAELRDGTRER